MNPKLATLLLGASVAAYVICATLIILEAAPLAQLLAATVAHLLGMQAGFINGTRTASTPNPVPERDSMPTA